MSEEKDRSPSGNMGGEEKPVSELSGTRRLLGVHGVRPGGKEEAAPAVWGRRDARGTMELLVESEPLWGTDRTFIK